MIDVYHLLGSPAPLVFHICQTAHPLLEMDQAFEAGEDDMKKTSLFMGTTGVPASREQVPVSKLAIVGSAGRKEDGAKITPELYSAMITKAKDTIALLWSERQINIDCLVSGGAAFADQVAVALFLQRFVPKLELYLPCQFNLEAGRFIVSGFDTTAATVDHYHRRFSEALKIDSLLQIKKALEMDECSVQVVPGFKQRNSAVAEHADCLLAMTFGSGRTVKPGGTSDTVEKFLSRPGHGPSFHMDLAKQLCYRNASVAA